MKKLVFFIGILWLLCISVSAQSLNAGEAILSWTAPTTNADGTPLTDLGGYKAYWGTASRNYQNNKDVGNVTTYKITGLGEGKWFFAVTAYDTSNNESAYSNEATKEIKIPPSPPAGCKVE
jgi:hypothetical protein